MKISSLKSFSCQMFCKISLEMSLQDYDFEKKKKKENSFGLRIIEELLVEL